MDRNTTAKMMDTAEKTLELIETALMNSHHIHWLLLVKLIRIAIHSAKIKTQK